MFTSRIQYRNTENELWYCTPIKKKNDEIMLFYSVFGAFYGLLYSFFRYLILWRIPNISPKSAKKTFNIMEIAWNWLTPGNFQTWRGKLISRATKHIKIIFIFHGLCILHVYQIKRFFFSISLLFESSFH